MKNNNYIFPNIISLDSSNSNNKNNSMCAFGILAGNIFLRSDTNKMDKIEFFQENFKFYHRFNNPLPIDYSDIEYHNELCPFYISNFTKFLKIMKGALYQSLIYHVYDLKTPYDFYNSPELMIEYGFVQSLDIYTLVNIDSLIIKKTKNVLENIDIFDKSILLDTQMSIIENDIIWIKYDFELGGIGKDDKSTIFILGWKINKVDEFENSAEIDSNKIGNEIQKEDQVNHNIIQESIIKKEDIKSTSEYESDQELKINSKSEYEIEIDNKNDTETKPQSVISELDSIKDNNSKYYKINGHILNSFPNISTFKISIYDNINFIKKIEVESLDDNSFSFQLPIIYENFYITATHKNILFYSGYYNYNSKIQLNSIETLVTELCKSNNESRAEIRSKILSNLKVPIKNFDTSDLFIRKICAIIDIYITNISHVIGRLQEITNLFSEFIFYFDDSVDLLNTDIIEKYIYYIENVYGILPNRDNIKNNILTNSTNIDKLDNATNISNSIDTFNNLPTIRHSMYTFKYTVDLEQRTVGTNTKSMIDFSIYSVSSDDFTFNPNDFYIDLSTIPNKANGCNSINFNINSDCKIKIIAESKRAKKYKWIKSDKEYTFDILLKGIFGEMLSSTGIVPIERTKNDYGENNNEEYENYPTDKSLERSISKPLETYFRDENNKIIIELEKYYKDLWGKNTESYINLFDLKGNRGVFLKGDVLKVPIDIIYRYKLKGSWDRSDTHKRRSVEGI